LICPGCYHKAKPDGTGGTIFHIDWDRIAKRKYRNRYGCGVCLRWDGNDGQSWRNPVEKYHLTRCKSATDFGRKIKCKYEETWCVTSIKWGVETAWHNWTHGTDRPGPEFWRYCATQEYVDNLRKEDKARMDIRIAQHMGHGIYQLCTDANSMKKRFNRFSALMKDVEGIEKVHMYCICDNRQYKRHTRGNTNVFAGPLGKHFPSQPDKACNFPDPPSVDYQDDEEDKGNTGIHLAPSVCATVVVLKLSLP